MRSALLFWLLAVSSTLHAAEYREPTPGDFVLRDFQFAPGEVLPELKIHYRTLGEPRRDEGGVVRNAVIVLHGLMPQQASLEEAFMHLTRDELEFATETEKAVA